MTVPILLREQSQHCCPMSWPQLRMIRLGMKMAGGASLGLACPRGGTPVPRQITSSGSGQLLREKPSRSSLHFSRPASESPT